MGRTWVLLIFFGFIPNVSTIICPEGFKANFNIPFNFTTNSHLAQCVKHCAETNCTGIILRRSSCLAVNLEDFYGEMKKEKFAKKSCIQGLKSVYTSYQMEGVALLGSTGKMATAQDEYHCMSLCSNEENFHCKSAMFFEEANDCLLNSENSQTSLLSNDTEGFAIKYFEMSEVRASAVCSNKNSLSFTVTSHSKSIEIRGETQLFDGSEGLDKCIERCGDGCDYVMFNEVFSECFIVHSDPTGQLLDFIDQEYLVLQSLCNSPVEPCTQKNSIYIVNKKFPKQKREECVRECMGSPNCVFAYSVDGRCVPSDVPLQLPQVLQRKCAGLEPNDYGILYEESEQCLSGPSLRVDNVQKTHCLTLCVTHPTQSCEAVAYYPEKKMCAMFEGTPQVTPSKDLCTFFTLNIIMFDKKEKEGGEQTDKHTSSHFIEAIPIASEGVSGKTEMRKPTKRKNHSKTSKAKAQGVPVATNNQNSIANDILKGIQYEKDDLELRVQPECHYDEVVIKINASKPFRGEAFPRNRHDDCFVAISGREGEMRLKLGGDKCQMDNNGDPNVYKTVIVIKRNEMESAVITDNDRLFHITCQYNGNVTVTARARPLKMNSPDYNSMAVGGRVKTGNVRMMKLRTRRDEKVEDVKLGQPLELMFDDEKLGKGYRVRECIASDMKGTENITIIVDGCPAPGADSFILRGPVIHKKKGFSIPFRAFKFSSGRAVKINCKVNICEKCPPQHCSELIRQRRSTADISENSEDLQITLNVIEESPGFCSPKPIFISVVIGACLIILVEISVLVAISRKSRKKSP